MHDFNTAELIDKPTPNLTLQIVPKWYVSCISRGPIVANPEHKATGSYNFCPCYSQHSHYAVFCPEKEFIPNAVNLESNYIQCTFLTSFM